MDSRLRDYPNFWQVLLAAELPQKRAWALLEELESTPLDPISLLLSHRSLTEGERKRSSNADKAGFEVALRKGAELWFPDDYPTRLTQSDWLPPVLMNWGNREVLNSPCVGIVGTRKASSYGKAAAQKFAEVLARGGVTVISGGAGGIDAHAHMGTLDAGGRTVAVLPCGIDVAYPKAHSNLYIAIREKGCLVSQFAAGKTPIEAEFLTRNRLIAALSDVLVVVEAPAKSGALSTARAASDLGREVLVVPGNIDRFGFKGSHQLIREGAILVDHPDHVFEALGITLAPRSAESLMGENALQGMILDRLATEPATAEILATELELQMVDLLGELTMLELEGLIVRDERGYAVRP